MIVKYLIWPVIVFIIGRLCYRSFMKFKSYRDDSIWGSKMDCELPLELPKKWPFGIDRIKDLWETNAEGRLLAYLCKIAEDYEPQNNLSQYLLFGPRAFHVLHPKNLEVVLSKNFKDYGFGVRPQIFAPLLGNGIFTQEGSEWQHSRDLLHKQFKNVQSQNFDQFREHVDNLIDRLPSSGEVDLQPLFFDLTMDIATALLFGRSVYTLRAGIDQHQQNKLFAESFNIAQEGLAKRFRIAPWHNLYRPKAFQKACDEVHRFVEQYIMDLDLDTVDDNEEKRYGFIKQIAKESCLETAQNHKAKRLGPNDHHIDGSKRMKNIRDQLLNVLLAGRDTTACCLSWTFRLLVRHADVMERLRKEISSVMGNESIPSREQIKRIRYLDYVIKESLRLYPPVPLNNREAVKTTLLPTGGGPDGDKPILVRKGELVVYSQYVNSRKKNIYGPDAYEFRPERWETGELDNIGWAYFPFSRGPRQCLGEEFARMEISYTIVRMLQTFSQITLPTGEPNEPVGTERQRLTLVLSSAEGCKVEVLKSSH